MSELRNSFTGKWFSYIPNEWGLEKLENLVTQKITYGIVQPGEYDPQGVYLIRGQDYMTGWKNLSTFYRVSKNLHERYRRSVVKSGDILLSIAGYVGTVAEVPECISEANITQTTARITCDKSIVNSKYLLHFMQSSHGQAQSRRYGKGSAQEGLNLEDVQSFLVPIPSIAEQNKISEVLDIADNLIQKTESQINKLKDLRVGMLAQLLTGGVQNSVNREKKSKLIPNNWVITTVGELVEKVIDNRGKTPPVNKNGNFELLEVASISPESKYPNYDLVTKYVSGETYSGWFRSGHPVINDILVPTVGSIGQFAILKENRGSIAQNIVAIRPNNLVDPEFFYYLLNGHEVQKGISTVLMGAVQPSLRVPHFLEIEVTIPPVQEQIQIRKILSSIDNRIDGMKSLLNKRKILKNALVQDLLTGKVRVKVN